MNNRSESAPKGKVHPETIPTVDHTSTAQSRVGAIEEVPITRETFTTTNSTSHSHPPKSKKSKQDYGPSLPILAALACCIPLAGILGYLIHQPRERVVTRTVTQTVPVLTVPASPVVTTPPVSPDPSATSPSPVGPGIVGPKTIGPGIVGPKTVGPGIVGADRVGNE